MGIFAHVVKWTLFPIAICLRIVVEISDAIDALFGGSASLIDPVSDALEKDTLVRVDINGDYFAGAVLHTDGDRAVVACQLPGSQWRIFKSLKISEIEYLH